MKLGDDGEEACLAEKALLVCERNDEEKVLKVYLTTGSCELSAFIEGEKSNFDQEERDQSKETTRDEKQNLIELFGDAKRKRGQRLKLKNRDIIDEKAAERTVKESSQKVMEKLEDEPVEMEEESMADLRPPYNPEATEPKKVYNMDVVFPPEIWQFLEEKGKELAKEAESNDFKLLSHNYSNFIAELAFNNKAKDKSLRILLYLDVLLRIHNTHGMGLKSLKVNFIPKAIMEKILNYYSTKDKNEARKDIRIKSRYQNLLLQTHIILLRLHLENFSIDTQKVANSLLKPANDIIKLAKFLGCTMKKSSGNESITANLICPIKLNQMKSFKSNKPKKNR